MRHLGHQLQLLLLSVACKCRSLNHSQNTSLAGLFWPKVLRHGRLGSCTASSVAAGCKLEALVKRENGPGKKGQEAERVAKGYGSAKD